MVIGVRLGLLTARAARRQPRPADSVVRIVGVQRRRPFCSVAMGDRSAADVTESERQQGSHLSEEHDLHEIMEGNRAWAAAEKERSPEFFLNLAAGQAPRFLWIGCSDSRVPENRLLGLQPGEVFVHRNVANLVHNADSNLLSVLTYALEALDIRHVSLQAAARTTCSTSMIAAHSISVDIMACTDPGRWTLRLWWRPCRDV
jgi:hypothetical protein